jgi:hypothetical protein
MKPRAPSRSIRPARAWLAFFLFLGAAVPFPPGTGQTRPSRNRPAAKEPSVATEASPPPFRIGEKLNYRIAWANFSSAATVQLAVAERRDLYGWDTWHLRAQAHTLSPVRALFAIDDQFDSYTDASTLESRQYEMYLQELGKQQNLVLHLTARGTPPRGAGATVIVQPGTRDPVGALYSLREVNWQTTAGARTPVFDGKTLYEMDAHREAAREQVTVAAGTYSAAKIEVHLYERGREVPDTRFEIWFAQDAARTPVLIQADVPFGSLRGELTGADR